MPCTKLVIAAYGVIAAASLWFRSAVPVHGIVTAAHDDLLFVRLAYYLGGGMWLGSHDQLTLAKGMGYPAFILMAFGAGIPLKIAEQMLYLAVAGLAAWLVGHLTRNRWHALVLFAVLAFNPVLWTGHLARVIREGTYVSLALALVVLAAVMMFAAGTRRSAPARLVLAIGLGVVGGIYWLTREEGIWLAPALALLVAACAVKAWREWRAGEHAGRAGRGLASAAVTVVVAGVSFAAVLSAVAGMNYRYYGAFITNEFHAAPFRSAYGALTRIQPEEWRRYMVFPKDARERAYAVSAAARELRPTIDGPVGEGWRAIACGSMRLDPCPDIPAGWFMWALRDAAAAAGHYSSAATAAAFYERLAAEINGACDDGRMSCYAPRATFMPPFRWEYVTDALALVPGVGLMLLRLSDSIGAPPSSGPQLGQALFGDLVGPLAREVTPVVYIWGTLRAAEGIPELFVRDRSGGPLRSELSLPAKGQSPRLHDRPYEFDLMTDCLRPSCELVVRSGVHERSFAIEGLAAGELVATSELQLILRHMVRRGQPPAIPVASEKRKEVQLGVMRAIAAFYAALMPILAGMAGVGVLLALALRRVAPMRPGVMALALACALAVATRIALLAFLEVSAFPAFNLLYLSPATPFALMFVVLGLYLGIHAGLAAYRTRRRSPLPT